MDCDYCDAGNLHSFHCLPNGMEVCDGCFARINLSNSMIENYQVKIKHIEEQIHSCSLPGDIEKLKKLVDDASYFIRRMDEESRRYPFTPEQIQCGKERKRRRME